MASSSPSFFGPSYLINGFRLIFKKSIQRFVWIPLLINITLLGSISIYAFNTLFDWYDSLFSWLALQTENEHWYIRWLAEISEWILSSLGSFLWPLIIINFMVVIFFIFTWMGNWIAAPFNALLSDAVRVHLGDKSIDSLCFVDTLKDFPRLILREWKKLMYYIPRLLLFSLILLTPLAFISPLIFLLFNGWMSAIQYIDIPNDNDRQPFHRTLKDLRRCRTGSIGFGVSVTLVSMIPFINLLIIPAAVAGSTQLWFEQYKTIDSNEE
jgi:CysZ protein